MARAKLESELKLAARIQADLFPASLPAIAGLRARRRATGRRAAAAATTTMRCRCAARTATARLLLCVADVSGKGLPASLRDEQHAGDAARPARAHRLAARAGRRSQRPAVRVDVAREVRDRGARRSRAARPARSRFVGAGHVDNVILRADGAIVALASTGTPLGLLPPRPAVRSRPTEARCRATRWCCSPTASPRRRTRPDEEFGEARLLDALRAAAGQPAEVVIERSSRPSTPSPAGAAVRRHHAPGRAAPLAPRPNPFPSVGPRLSVRPASARARFLFRRPKL